MTSATYQPHLLALSSRWTRQAGSHHYATSEYIDQHGIIRADCDAEAGSTVDVLKDGSSIGTTTATATNGAWTITVTLTDGANTFTATATDSAGNTSDATDAVIITLDSVAPSVDISSTSGSNGATANTRTLSYTAALMRQLATLMQAILR